MSSFATKWVRLATNWTNRGLFQIRSDSLHFGSLSRLKSDLINSRIGSIWGHFGLKYLTTLELAIQRLTSFIIRNAPRLEYNFPNKQKYLQQRAVTPVLTSAQGFVRFGPKVGKIWENKFSIHFWICEPTLICLIYCQSDPL